MEKFFSHPSCALGADDRSVSAEVKPLGNKIFIASFGRLCAGSLDCYLFTAGVWVVCPANSGSRFV